MEEMDEVGQELERALRVTLTGGGQLAEAMARRSEARNRSVARAEGEQLRQLQQQQQQEMQAARLIYRPAVEERWWQAATERDAARVWDYAAGWSAHDPQARAAAAMIRQHAAKTWPDADLDKVLNRAWSFNAVEDYEAAIWDAASARHERADAAARDDLHDLEDQAAEADEDDPELATSLTREAEGYQAEAVQLREHAAATGGGAGAAAGGAGEPYARTSEKELVGVRSSAAKTARMDSAPGFGRPAKDAVRPDGKGASKARPSKSRTSAKVRDAELGR